jgi:hypothetical protein
MPGTATATQTTSEQVFFRIGEVSRLTGLKPFVLRYWETEFPMQARGAICAKRMARAGVRFPAKTTAGLVMARALAQLRQKARRSCSAAKCY